jgi:hypothetical protein
MIHLAGTTWQPGVWARAEDRFASSFVAPPSSMAARRIVAIVLDVAPRDLMLFAGSDASDKGDESALAKTSADLLRVAVVKSS